MTKYEFFKAWQVTKRLNHMSKRDKQKTDSRSDNPPSCGASIGDAPRFTKIAR